MSWFTPATSWYVLLRRKYWVNGEWSGVKVVVPNVESQSKPTSVSRFGIVEESTKVVTDDKSHQSLRRTKKRQNPCQSTPNKMILMSTGVREEDETHDCRRISTERTMLLNSLFKSREGRPSKPLKCKQKMIRRYYDIYLIDLKKKFWDVTV